jgi:hypothetical protein
MLFGHQNDDNHQSASTLINDVSPTNAPGVNPLAVDPDTGVSLPVAPEDLEHDSAPEAPVLQQTQDASEPADTTPAIDSPPSTSRDDILQTSGSDDLLALKQQALEELSPLVGHLEQSPEEKFRTTMMLIQSSDNQALIKDAYAAAQAISDDKVRAQALLDIVNEINYFTQHNATEA